jgi:hypothetical protein
MMEVLFQLIAVVGIILGLIFGVLLIADAVEGDSRDNDGF